MRKRDPYARWLEPTSNMSVWSPMHDRIRQDFGRRMFSPMKHRVPGSFPWGVRASARGVQGRPAVLRDVPCLGGGAYDMGMTSGYAEWLDEDIWIQGSIYRERVVVRTCLDVTVLSHPMLSVEGFVGLSMSQSVLGPVSGIIRSTLWDVVYDRVRWGLDD